MQATVAVSYPLVSCVAGQTHWSAGGAADLRYFRSAHRADEKRMAGKTQAVPKVVRSEWLELQSKVLRLWERRYVVLQEEKLLFFKPGNPPTEPGKLALEVRCDCIINVLGPVESDFRLRLELGR